MKPTFQFLFLLPLTLVGAIPNDAGLRRAIDSTTYRVEASGTGGYTATNNGQHLQAQFNQGVTRFQYGALWFSLELTGAGPMQRTSVNGNRLNYYRPGVTEWFINEPAGLEQGFTFERKPAAGPLTVTLMVGGDLRPELDGQEVALRDHSQIRLRYQGLKSWDAGGKVLPSRMEVVGRVIRLVVDDAGARYPVTVDPTIKEDKLVTGTEPATADLGPILVT